MSEQQHAQAYGDGLPVPTRQGGAFKTAERRAAEVRAAQAEVESDAGLFDIQAPPPTSLRDRFGTPPFSLLDRRAGEWQDRKRRWLQYGIQSELGRSNNLLGGGKGGAERCLCTHFREDHLGATGAGDQQEVQQCARCSCRDYRPTAKANSGAYGAQAVTGPDGQLTYEITTGATSVFDPVLCELVYRWYSAPGHTVLDPFAGGSVRGVVAGLLERRYLGIDLREEQVLANREQGQSIVTDERYRPRWAVGDSRQVLQRIPAGSVDLMWSCPPYADLEVYSDDPADLSTMPYEEFLEAQAEIIHRACAALKPNRFACWVTSDIRDKKGFYRGLGRSTVEAFEEAGLRHYNEGIVMDPVGSAAVRTGKIFNAGRKLTRMHQYLLVFVKGDWKQATLALGESEQMRGAEQ